MPRKKKQSAANAVKDIRRKTRRKFSSEEKIRIVLEGLRGEQSVSELCRREGIAQTLYYRWSKEFLEAGKQRLAGDTKRSATSGEVKEIQIENLKLKQLAAELMLESLADPEENFERMRESLAFRLEAANRARVELQAAALESGRLAKQRQGEAIVIDGFLTPYRKAIAALLGKHDKIVRGLMPTSRRSVSDVTEAEAERVPIAEVSGGREGEAATTLEDADIEAA